MAKLTVIPMIGAISRERAKTLVGCHALLERTAVRTFEPGKGTMGPALESAVKELILADRVAALQEGRTQFIVTIEP